MECQPMQHMVRILPNRLGHNQRRIAGNFSEDLHAILLRVNKTVPHFFAKPMSALDGPAYALDRGDQFRLHLLLLGLAFAIRRRPQIAAGDQVDRFHRFLEQLTSFADRDNRAKTFHRKGRKPGSHMTINENGVLLRVFIGESDRFGKQPLFEAIVQKVRELGLGGATVLRGSEGFGANSVVHKTSLLEMSSDLPIVIEIVDTREKIDLLLPHLETMVQEGMITMEYVKIVMYRHNPADRP